MDNPVAQPLPEPLVSAEVDLRGYEFMPLHGDVLFRSAFWKRATDAEKLAALKLWWSAWWEVPAGSLPNNERDLAHLAGVDVRRWRLVRPAVMAKWVLCRDDRWYLPFLADLALLSFSKRKSLSLRGRIGAAKRWGNNDQTNGSANATGNATATETDGPANATATGKAWPKNGKGSEVEVKTPPTPSSSAASSRPRRFNGAGPNARAAPRHNPTGVPGSPPQGREAAERQIQHTKAIIDEQRENAARAAPPPGGSVAAVARAAGIRIPTNQAGDWKDSTDTIDSQGTALGMQRLAFESDDEYITRIQQRMNLG